MRLSDQPEPEASPLLGRIPPTPPGAPPTTGEVGSPSPHGDDVPARQMGLGKLVGISLIGMLGAVLLVGIPSTLLPFAVGASFGLLGARSPFITRLAMMALAASLIAALASAVLLGNGAFLGGLFRGLAVWLAIAPAVLTVVFYQWARWPHRRASA